MNLQVFQADTFRRHARTFLEPAINHKWKRDQQVLMERLRAEGSVAVGGRMRADLLGEQTPSLVSCFCHLVVTLA